MSSMFERLRDGILRGLNFRQRDWLRRARAFAGRYFSGARRPVYGVGGEIASTASGRALISYLPSAFRMDEKDARFVSHVSFWRTREMARILNSLGYVVDVVDFTDTKFLPRRDYDLFIGHGGHNFERIAGVLKPESVKIYFFSGCYWRFHNRSELARFDALRRRRGVTLPPDRLVTQSEEGALRMADALMGVGNEYTRRTFARFRSVHMIPSAVPPDETLDIAKKDFAAGRRHFLFFAGPGNVHKGLDLLLEAFSLLEKQELWICTRIEPAFASAYEEALRRRPNIHVVEWIRPRSERFYDLMRRCNWTILPSCAEGVATSVVACMNQGLIPVVSEACGIEVDDCGTLLKRCTVDEIAETARALSEYSPEECMRMSRAARRVARTHHSREACSGKMQAALTEILRQKRGSEPEPSAPVHDGYEAAYKAAVGRLRRERPREAYESYIDGNNREAAFRFHAGEEFAETYRLLRSAGLPDKAAILDLGAGNGIASYAFASRGHVVCAVEPCASEDYGAGAVAKLRRDTGSAIEVVRARGEALPFSDETFDCVYVRQCLHHAGDLAGMIAEAARVLKPGGLFFAAREHVVSNDAQLRRFLAEHPIHQVCGGENAYRLKEYRNAIRRAGMRLLRVIRPYDSAINLYPDTIAAVTQRAERRLARIVGGTISRRVVALRIFARLLREALNLLRRRPGRLYSFLAVKERIPRGRRASLQGDGSA